MHFHDELIQMKVEEGFWNQKINQREFLEDLGASLGYKQLEDWYDIRYFLFSSKRNEWKVQRPLLVMEELVY